MGTLIAACGGSIVTAILFWLYPRFDRWWDRPILKVETGTQDGFVSLNPLFDLGGQQQGSGCYVRVKVTNVGKHVARKCTGYLTAVEEWSGGAFQPTSYTDILRLVWSHNAECVGMDLVTDTPHWLDVLSTLEGTQAFRLETAVKPFRYGDGFGNTSVYRLTIQVVAEEIDPVVTHLYIRWDGNWNNRTLVLGEKEVQASCPAAKSQSG